MYLNILFPAGVAITLGQLVISEFSVHVREPGIACKWNIVAILLLHLFLRFVGYHGCGDPKWKTARRETTRRRYNATHGWVDIASSRTENRISGPRSSRMTSVFSNRTQAIFVNVSCLPDSRAIAVAPASFAGEHTRPACAPCFAAAGASSVCFQEMASDLRRGGFSIRASRPGGSATRRCRNRLQARERKLRRGGAFSMAAEKPAADFLRWPCYGVCFPRGIY